MRAHCEDHPLVNVVFAENANTNLYVCALHFVAHRLSDVVEKRPRACNGDIGTDFFVYDAVRLGDGTLALAGYREVDLKNENVVVRADTTGALVPSFGKGGVLALPLAPDRVIVDAQGRIVTAGGRGGVSVARILP